MRSRKRLHLLAYAALLVAALAFGTRWGDASLYPPMPGTGIPILLVSNGYHSGLVLPRQDVADVASRRGAGAALAVATRFGHYRWIEAGWGEDRFYRNVPTVDAFEWRLALRALFAPGNASVVHIVGLEDDSRAPFRSAQVVALELSPEGFARLVTALDASFARDREGLPDALGPGLSGPSLFYRAVGTFSAMNVCNHWTARLLDAAGVPTAPWLATLPGGLLLDLQHRSGLKPEPDALPVAAPTH